MINKLITTIVISIFILPFSVNGQQQKPMNSMPCPMMENMSNMMEEMQGMMQMMSDPDMKDRMQKMHEQMGTMMQQMGEMHGGQNGQMMQCGKMNDQSPSDKPDNAPQDDEDHQSHHPEQSK